MFCAGLNQDSGGGGAKIQSIEDLYPYMDAKNGWSIFGENSNAYGLHFPEKRTLSTFGCRVWTLSNRKSTVSMPDTMLLNHTLQVACYNEGDSSVTWQPVVEQIQYGEANGEDDFTFNMQFTATGEFEYWLFRPMFTALMGGPVKGAFEITEQSEWAGYDDVFYSSYSAAATSAFQFPTPTAAADADLTIARRAGTNYRNFSYSRQDINRAIAAFNAANP
jgi:hypothetical protein